MSTCYECGRNECDCVDQEIAALVAAAESRGRREGQQWAIDALREEGQRRRENAPSLASWAVFLTASSYLEEIKEDI